MNNSSVKRKHPEKGSRFPGNKRRCEKRSSYIEELYELITASLSNPESLNMKPDKCALLQETLSQIKRIKQQQDAEHGEEVQHSHVSSSKPGVPSGDSLGSVLLETLDGFLFVVNSQGEIEYVTENVNSYLNYQQVMGLTFFSLAP
ncbi:nuclear receptor coactivator 3-like isoform X2 [Lytechinus pictus]|uniref:nuclear receptor coactivator 3-like isoform X2 n=1 Tax=Lytechinus pictus TaxID=7653 RepID=UPI00240E5EC1|nr:nuclear receptor coactivator 3-like isoform X2 [Lytechinus pictus]